MSKPSSYEYQQALNEGKADALLDGLITGSLGALAGGATGGPFGALVGGLAGFDAAAVNGLRDASDQAEKAHLNSHPAEAGLGDTIDQIAKEVQEEADYQADYQERLDQLERDLADDRADEDALDDLAKGCGGGGDFDGVDQLPEEQPEEDTPALDSHADDPGPDFDEGAH